MTSKKLVVAFALLLSATSIVMAQDNRYHRPGPYFGNDYGPDNASAANAGGSVTRER
jgi:hypothetical protein